MGLQARLMSQALRKLAGVVSKTNTCIIFINQIRMKIGVMFGNPETTTGGNALKFYSSVRLDIRRIANLKEGEEIIGNRTKVKVVKNKVAPPFRVAEFDIVYGEGISYHGDLVDLGVQVGVIDKSGTWMTFGAEKLGQGRERAKQTLRDQPELARRIEERIRAHYKAQAEAAATTSAASAAAVTAAATAPVPTAVGGTPEALRASKPETGSAQVEPSNGRGAAKSEPGVVKPEAKPDVKSAADGKSSGGKPHPAATTASKPASVRR